MRQRERERKIKFALRGVEGCTYVKSKQMPHVPNSLHHSDAKYLQFVVLEILEICQQLKNGKSN